MAVLGAGGEPGGFPVPAARAPLADNQQRVGEDGAGSGRAGGRTCFGGRGVAGVPVLQPHEPAVVQRHHVGDVQVRAGGKRGAVRRQDPRLRVGNLPAVRLKVERLRVKIKNKQNKTENKK